MKALIFAVLCVVLLCAGCKDAPDCCGVQDVVLETEPRVITIGENAYTLRHTERRKMGSDHTLYDVYTVVEERNTLSRHTVGFLVDSGKMIKFNGIEPFAPIDGIADMTDEALRETVEGLLAEYVDFSLYNTFELHRPNDAGGVYGLDWHVEREITCNIGTVVYINYDGTIDYFSKIDACPDAFPPSLDTEEKRIKKLERKLRRHLKTLSLRKYEYRILYEGLSYSHGEPVVNYIVAISENGFSHFAQTFSIQ